MCRFIRRPNNRRRFFNPNYSASSPPFCVCPSARCRTLSPPLRIRALLRFTPLSGTPYTRFRFGVPFRFASAFLFPQHDAHRIRYGEERHARVAENGSPHICDTEGAERHDADFYDERDDDIFGDDAYGFP